MSEESHESAPPNAIYQQAGWKRRTWLIGTALLLALAGAAYGVFRLTHKREQPFAHNSRFVTTQLPPTGIRRYSVSPGPVMKCSIHGFLSQCTEVSGVRYVMPKVVAAGQVDFGAAATLTPPQFVQAFTQALQTNQPEWMDRAKVRYKENLVLLTNDAETVLVLPQAMAREFQKHGAN